MNAWLLLGLLPLEQMVQHPWVLGREEEAKLLMGEFLFRHQRSDAHFSPYNYRRLPSFPGPCLVSRSWRAQEQRLRVYSQDRKNLGENSREVPVASLWAPGRDRGLHPYLPCLARMESPPLFSSRCPSWPLKIVAPCPGRQTRRGMSRLAGSKRRWVGGEVTAAFPWLTWSQTGDLATGSQLCASVKGGR